MRATIMRQEESTQQRKQTNNIVPTLYVGLAINSTASAINKGE